MGGRGTSKGETNIMMIAVASMYSSKAPMSLRSSTWHTPWEHIMYYQYWAQVTEVLEQRSTSRKMETSGMSRVS